MEDSSKLALGGRIAQARRALSVREWRDVTHAELAGVAKASAQAVSRWEAGKNRPDDLALEALAAFLGADPDWLKSGAGMPPSAKYPSHPPKLGRRGIPISDVTAQGRHRRGGEGGA